MQLDLKRKSCKTSANNKDSLMIPSIHKKLSPKNRSRSQSNLTDLLVDSAIKPNPKMGIIARTEASE